MFGEPLALPRRQRDVNLPLFMKLYNIEVFGNLRKQPIKQAYTRRLYIIEMTGQIVKQFSTSL